MGRVMNTRTPRRKRYIVVSNGNPDPQGRAWIRALTNLVEPRGLEPHDPVVVIPGASTIGQLEANAAATDITLTQADQQALTDIAIQLSRLSGRAKPAAA
jgi:hypothetical protein